jgi:NADPH:quinone reductase-like Zn-dependent oxidoreductase
VEDTSRVASVVDATAVLEMGGRYVFVRPEREHLDALAELADAGKLRVDVAERFPLERIADAHRMSADGHAGGKIVVTV